MWFPSLKRKVQFINKVTVVCITAPWQAHYYDSRLPAAWRQMAAAKRLSGVFTGLRELHDWTAETRQPSYEVGWRATPVEQRITEQQLTHSRLTPMLRKRFSTCWHTHDYPQKSTRCSISPASVSVCCIATFTQTQASMP